MVYVVVRSNRCLCMNPKTGKSSRFINEKRGRICCLGPLTLILNDNWICDGVKYPGFVKLQKEDCQGSPGGECFSHFTVHNLIYTISNIFLL